MIGEVHGTVGRTLTFEGYANDFDKAITSVEFSFDDGATWTRYQTPGATSERNLYWSFGYVPREAGTYELLVRSVNEDGVASPSCARVPFTVD